MKFYFLIFIIFTTLKFIYSARDPQGKLLQVVQTFRHGARYRIYDTPYPDDQKINYGQLTAQGQRMNYMLGRTLYNKYSKALNFPKTYNHTFIYVKSTNYDRTIQSAASQLAGMFPLKYGLKITNISEEYLKPPFSKLSKVNEKVFALPYGQQPIPIHVQEFNEDKQLLGYLDSCPMAKEWLKESIQSKVWKRIEENYKDLIDELVKDDYFGFTEQPDLYQIQHLVDTLTSYKWEGNIEKNNEIAMHVEGFLLNHEEMLLPENFNLMWMQLNLLYSTILQASLFQTPQQKKTSITPFFTKLLTYFNNILEGADGDNYRWIMLSAHDTTIAMISQAMNFTSWECLEKLKLNKKQNQNCIYTYPGFDSNIIFELYQDNHNKAYIKALYNGTEQALCGTSDKFCYLDKFIEAVQYSSVSDFDYECGIYSQEQRIQNQVSNASGNVSNSYENIPTWIIYSILILSICLIGSLIQNFLQRRKIIQLNNKIQFNIDYSTI